MTQKHIFVAGIAATAITFASLTMSVETQPADTFDRFFTGRTMRVDYFHTGGLGKEI